VSVEFSKWAITVLEDNESRGRPEVAAAFEQVPAAIIGRQTNKPLTKLTGGDIVYLYTSMEGGENPPLSRNCNEGQFHHKRPLALKAGKADGKG
jgi:hypothetical protein